MRSDKVMFNRPDGEHATLVAPSPYETTYRAVVLCTSRAFETYRKRRDLPRLGRIQRTNPNNGAKDIPQSRNAIKLPTVPVKVTRSLA